VSDAAMMPVLMASLRIWGPAPAADSSSSRRRRDGGRRREGEPGVSACLGLVQLFADHAEWQVVVALEREPQPQTLDVGRRELAVPGFRARRCDDALCFEEAQLAGGQIGELGGQARKDLTNAQKTRRR
jgi:hypothetical protein